MSKVAFRVSARAARLIGRENVATSQGAVTELVKNGYDADATVCAVLFVPRWRALPDVFSRQEFGELERICPAAAGMVVEVEGNLKLKPDLSPEERQTVEQALSEILDLWIDCASFDGRVGWKRSLICTRLGDEQTYQLCLILSLNSATAVGPLPNQSERLA